MRIPAFLIVIAMLALVAGFGVCVGARGWAQSSQKIPGVTATVSAGLFTIDAEVDGVVLTSGRYCTVRAPTTRPTGSATPTRTADAPARTISQIYHTTIPF